METDVETRMRRSRKTDEHHSFVLLLSLLRQEKKERKVMDRLVFEGRLYKTVNPNILVCSLDREIRHSILTTGKENKRGKNICRKM